MKKKRKLGTVSSSGRRGAAAWNAGMASTVLLWLFLLSPGVLSDSEEPLLRGRETALLGKEARFECSVDSSESSEDVSEVEVWWQARGRNVTSKTSDRYAVTVSKSADGNVTSALTIASVDWEDEGVYSCVAAEVGEDGQRKAPAKQKILLDVLAAPKYDLTDNGKGKVGDSSEMSCSFKGRPRPKVSWFRFGNLIEEDQTKYEIATEKKSDIEVKSYLKILNLHHDDNGTFLCQGDNEYGSDIAILENLVLDKPGVNIEYVRGVAKDSLYLNWTVNEWNSPITDYFLSYRESGEDAWVYFISEKIDAAASSFVMRGLQPDSEYHLKLAAKNRFGMGEFDLFHASVRTLDFDPVFVPEVLVKGLTWNSISIGWSKPADERVAEHIDYYKLTKKTTEQEVNMYHPSDKFSFYLWRHLEPATNYSFTVSACSAYTRECGRPSSPPVSAATEDGLSGPPAGAEAFCRHDNISGMNFVEVTWKQPKNAYGQLEFYNIQLRGSAQYLDAEGRAQVELFGPEEKTEDADTRRTRFDFLKPNTNYTVEVCGVTRRKECGQTTTASCKMRQTPPRAEHLNRFQWLSDSKSGHPVFRLRMPRMSERNGRICCLRVIVVRLGRGQEAKDLPHQSELVLSSYRKVHPRGDEANGGESDGPWGAYIAEILGANFMGKDVLVGDGQNILSAHMGGCPACQTGVRSHLLQAARAAESRTLLRRLAARSAASLPARPTELVEDGYLDPESNYTAFVELIIPDSTLVGRSPYMAPRKPGQEVPSVYESGSAGAFIVCVVGILAGLVLVALCLLAALVLLKRYSKKVAATQGGVEMSMRRSLRHFCSTLRTGGASGRGAGANGAAGSDPSQYLISPDGAAAAKADVGPIDKDDLVGEYQERHKDSDYGFQAEFELLPDRFADRTTDACDSAVNRPKNRYPDIRCYDQTRVKLKETDDGKEGSDYINANFVQGYKDRKKWICAQGPLEATVADFWRMIHEQGVGIIIMLTNLEEYNRIKCAQYWPQAGDSNYSTDGSHIINVCFCTETRYSDYIVRELRLTATRGEEKEERTVLQYHYLQWKDFNAPEHAPGMLKFAKRINEAWSKLEGGGFDLPTVVHCSAGVGRSGTLIAIDSLSQQLEDEGKVTIYKTVCDLRHQRNYLVQSVKQFMFVYRAIMELAQFGDTEVEASKMKSRLADLSTDSSRPMEREFERLSSVVDDRKPVSVGANDENAVKNQCSTVIPYDRNRVILTPDGVRPHSTYINASFIEGYHNDESFIITQDPLPSTAEDFWRMVTEHSISTMVMLSGEKAWKYWSDEGETSFGALKVTLNNTEKLPHYVKRDFTVLNTKVDEEVSLTHFEYSSWSGEDSSQVPSSTSGLLDLVEHASALKAESGQPGPIAVHCRRGSDRSSVYVALSCLALQIKNEARCDVFTVVRKLRAQRQGMVQHMNQYKFIYKATSDYVDLYRNKDEEYAYSVPINAVNGNKK